MKANELRIGNWVSWNGENGVVSQILEHEVVFKCGEDTLISELKPIELTEDIFNSIPYEHLVYLADDFKTFIIHTEDVSYVFLLADYPYLHNLQNLFFALMRYELEINL